MTRWLGLAVVLISCGGYQTPQRSPDPSPVCVSDLPPYDILCGEPLP